MSSDTAAPQPKAKHLWIGLVEVRPISGTSEILGDARGAFVNIVTWASNTEDYRRNAEIIVEKLGNLFVFEVVNPEPVEKRRAKAGELDSETEDMIARAESNPNAIVYGTFHMFENEDA